MTSFDPCFGSSSQSDGRTEHDALRPRRRGREAHTMRRWRRPGGRPPRPTSLPHVFPTPHVVDFAVGRSGEGAEWDGAVSLKLLGVALGRADAVEHAGIDKLVGDSLGTPERAEDEREDV